MDFFQAIQERLKQKSTQAETPVEGTPIEEPPITEEPEPQTGEPMPAADCEDGSDCATVEIE